MLKSDNNFDAILLIYCAFKSWTDNMTRAGVEKVTPAKGEDFTCITFYPDLAKFKMDSLDKDIVDLFTRRAYDIVASTKGVKVFLNGKKLPVHHGFFLLFIHLGIVRLYI